MVSYDFALDWRLRKLVFQFDFSQSFLTSHPVNLCAFYPSPHTWCLVADIFVTGTLPKGRVLGNGVTQLDLPIAAQMRHLFRLLLPVPHLEYCEIAPSLNSSSSPCCHISFPVETALHSMIASSVTITNCITGFSAFSLINRCVNNIYWDR